ncbi:MAG: hypothetical protein GEU75_04860 [Dehalococcoidia bacterium]|nr:hypothetical protein [Dehalococcoidia bacterium]
MNHNLRFLSMPDQVISRICEVAGGTPGHIPHQLVRGVDRDVPSVYRDPQVIYGREDMPEEFAFLLARALDHNHDLFRQTALPLSYDPSSVARDIGIPLHVGAERYYREVGYPVGARGRDERLVIA